MKAIDVLEASGLFSSRSDIHRIVKQKGAKINGQTVDSPDEEIEPGDFLNFVWLFPSAYNMMVEHGKCFLLIAKGKKDKTLVRVLPDGTFEDGSLLIPPSVV